MTQPIIVHIDAAGEPYVTPQQNPYDMPSGVQDVTVVWQIDPAATETVFASDGISFPPNNQFTNPVKSADSRQFSWMNLNSNANAYGYTITVTGADGKPHKVDPVIQNGGN